MIKRISCIALLGCFFFSAAAQTIDFVDPFIGTSDDHGQTDPSASVPFGMIKPGPETSPRGHGGYDYQSAILDGFTQARMSGTGCSGVGGDILIKPFASSPEETLIMDKSSEKASCGYYSVDLSGGIKVEATAGRTSAYYRITYPASESAGIRVDLSHSFTKYYGEQHRISGGHALEGWVSSACNCDAGCYKFYYHLEISRATKVVEDGPVVSFFFGTSEREQVEVRIGLSTVSVEAARRNLRKELAHQDFDKTLAKARRAWDDLLGRVRIETDDDDLRKSFYTRLYQSCLTPYAINDISGSYRGSDGKEYRNREGDHYHGWSMWDTYRTKYPLLSLVSPTEYRRMAASLIELYRQGKPRSATDREPFLTTRTEHSIITLLDACEKGLMPGRARDVLPFMIDDSEEIPADSPDQILERCYDFWALSVLAGKAGDSETQKLFSGRSREYRKMWKEKFMNMGPSSDVMHGDGLYEGTLWQYRWFVPHDFDWVISNLGGAEAVSSQLDYFFDNHLFNIGNQPDIQVPYLYDYIGEPWKSQKLVHDILLEPTVNYYGTHVKWETPFIGKVFATSPDGYLKEMDEDSGTMSSWYVLSSIGLFPVCPGVPYFWIGSPLFSSIVLSLPHGRSFSISVDKPSEESIYIQKASLNGMPLSRSWLGYDEIMKGGILELELGEAPNKDWGSDTSFISALFL